MEETGDGEREWYSLDNAGKAFPSIVSSRMSTVFRVSANLREDVDTAILAAALRMTIGRYPYFQVHLRKGFFWYYLERTSAIPPILPDSKHPCETILMKRRGVFLFRVRVFGRNVAVEASHTLTDGFGTLSFLKSLIAEYLQALHGHFDDWGDILRPGDVPDPEETEDAFVRHYNHFAPPPRRMTRAFHLMDPHLPVGKYPVLTGVISVAAIKEAAAKRKVTINDILLAALLAAFQERMTRLPRLAWKPIRLIVPINLRRLFGSRTLRNFTLFVLPEIDPRLGKYEFDEILMRVHHFMKMETNEKSVHSDMSRNIRGEKSMFIRLMPRVIKDMVIAGIFFAFGENAATSSLSNLGTVALPEAMARYVASFDFIPATGRETRTNCGVVSFGDVLHVSFGRMIKNADIERLFFGTLIKTGIPVKVVSR